MSTDAVVRQNSTDSSRLLDIEPRLRPRRELSLDRFIYIGLFSCTGAAFLWMVRAANLQAVLTGEEASVTFVDVVAIGERFQWTNFSTNFASHIVFWVGSLVDPSFDLFYGRIVKAILMALLAPLLYLTMRRRFQSSPVPAAIAALVGVALPGVISFSWLATETGFDAIAGLVGLLVATSKRSWWWTAPVFAGVCVSLYGGGIPWALAIGAAIAVRLVSSFRQDWRAWSAVASSSLAALTVVFFPVYWWRGGRVVLGGGSLDLSEPWVALSDLFAGNVIGAQSYYYFNNQAGLGSVGIALIGLAGLFWLMVELPRVWPWLFVLTATIAMYAVSGGILGIRRTIAIPLICALAIGFILQRLADRVRELHRAAPAVALGIMAVILLAPLGTQASENHLSLATGVVPLPIDFVLPLGSEGKMPAEIAAIAQSVRDGRSWLDVARAYEGTRVSAIIYLLSDRGAIEPVPVTGSTVKRLYEQGPRCDSSCTPIMGLQY